MKKQKPKCPTCGGSGVVTRKLDWLPPNVLRRLHIPGQGLDSVVDWSCVDCQDMTCTITLTRKKPTMKLIVLHQKENPLEIFMVYRAEDFREMSDSVVVFDGGAYTEFSDIHETPEQVLAMLQRAEPSEKGEPE